MTARVTVAIPTYNRSAWLRRAIRSVLDQTFTDVEVLVTDNASEDDTAEVVQGFGDPRIRYVRRPENVGLLANHNLALEAVTTEYCVVLADDDTIEPRFLEATVDVLDRNPGAGLAHTNFDMVDGNDEVIAADVNWTHGLDATTVERGEDFIRESMRWSCRVCASTTLIRTAALTPGIFQEADFPAIDLGLWLRMATQWDVAFVHERLGTYRIHEASHSAAYGRTIGDGYVQGAELVTRLRAIKERFIAGHAPTPAVGTAWRKLADEGRRHELILMIRNLTLPERRFGDTLETFRAAVGVDRRVAVEVAAWRLLLASALGGRAVDALRSRSSAESEAVSPHPAVR